MALVNRTVDDAQLGGLGNATVVYLGDWISYTNNNLSYTDLSSESLFNNTLHLANSSSSGTQLNLTFTGVAIYLICVLENNNNDVTNLSFALDGIQAGSFIYYRSAATSNLTEHVYNQTVFAHNSLSNTAHNLVVTLENSTLGSGSNSLMLFDYFIYTAIGEQTVSGTSSTLSTPRGLNTKQIIGATIGTSAFLVVLVLLIWFYWRRPRRSNESIHTMDFHIVDYWTEVEPPLPPPKDTTKATTMNPPERPFVIMTTPAASYLGHSTEGEVGHGQVIPPPPPLLTRQTSWYSSSKETLPIHLSPRTR